MTKSHKKHSAKEGYVLSVVLVIMVTFSVTCASIMNFSHTNNIETGTKASNMQTFWTSESATALATRHLELDPVFRANPTTLTGQVANTSFTVDVTKTFNNYTINSCSVNGSWKKTTTQIISTRPLDWHESFSNYVAYVNNGFITTDPSATLTGLSLDNTVVADETMPALDVSLTKELIKQNYALIPVLQPIYSDQDAITYTEVWVKPEQLTSFTDSTTINSDKTITTSDDGTIGTLNEINSMDKLEFGTGSTIGKSNVFYAVKDITIGAGSVFDQGTTLISGESIMIEAGSSIQGAVYARKEVLISSNVFIQGSIVSGTGITIGANSQLVHDPSMLSSEVPEFLEGTPEHLATRHKWEE